jgi:hypothetical protein
MAVGKPACFAQTKQLPMTIFQFCTQNRFGKLASIWPAPIYQGQVTKPVDKEMIALYNHLKFIFSLLSCDYI